MRISDWSSDVCSSDLLALVLPLLFDALVGHVPDEWGKAWVAGQTVHHDSHVLGARARTDQQGIGGADHCYALQAEGGDRQDRALQIAVVAVDRQNFAVEDVAAVVLVGGLVERIPADRKSTRLNSSH